MTLCRLLSLLLALAFSACGGGGGGRDLTVISGNVLSASGSSAGLSSPTIFARLRALIFPEAVAQVPGITVEILNTSRTAVTDDAGLFRMEVGQFGPTNLRFSGNGANAVLSVVLPFGGDYRIIDVELSGSSITVAEQQVDFRGPITGIDCNQDLLVVLSGERVSYRVQIAGTTIIRNENGEDVSCPELILGQEAEVFSIVENQDTVVAAEIRVNPRLAPAPTSTAAATPTSPATPTPTPTTEATSEATVTATATATPVAPTPTPTP